MKVVALVLAAGVGHRFGGVKQLAQLNSRPLFHYAVQVAAHCCDPVVLITGAHAEQISLNMQPLSQEWGDKLSIHRAPDWQLGMGASLASGVRLVAPEADAILVLLADQPLVSKTHLQRLIRHQRLNPCWAVATRYSAPNSDLLGVPALFGREAFDDLAALNADYGARQLFKTSNRPIPSIDADFDLIDVDRPEDLDKVKTSVTLLKR